MSKLSFLQNLGLKLLGTDALAAIKGEVVDLTRKTVEDEHATALREQPLSLMVGASRLETFFHDTLRARARAGSNQVTSALLLSLVGDNYQVAYSITEAARVAEESGEGFMKKKAAVLRAIREKELGLSKSQEQLVIELAVQLIRD